MFLIFLFILWMVIGWRWLWLWEDKKICFWIFFFLNIICLVFLGGIVMLFILNSLCLLFIVIWEKYDDVCVIVVGLIFL